MNKQAWIAAAALGLLTLLTPQGARAQYIRPPTSPFPRPPVSPYLNLFRGGNPAINYYGVIRPQEQFNQSLMMLQQQMQATNQATLAYGDPTLPATGHPTRFMNYSHYFLNQGGAGTGAYGGGAYGTGGLGTPWTTAFPQQRPQGGLAAPPRMVR